MKNRHILILIFLFFVLGFFVYKIYFYNKLENINNLTLEKIETKSGFYKDLKFQSLRKDGDSYYIKFSKQQEDKIFPDYCYQDNVFVENFENNCVAQGRPLQDKIKPDIKLEKEYKITGNVDLIHKNIIDRELLSINKFFNLINKENAISPNYYYGNIIEEPENWSFDISIINEEINLMSQVYKE